MCVIAVLSSSIADSFKYFGVVWRCCDISGHHRNKIFFLLSLFKVKHIAIWNLIKEKDTNDKQFFIRGIVKTECWLLLKLDNAIKEIKL